MNNVELSNVGRRMGLYLKRNSSTILTVVAAFGVVATGVMAAKAAPKAKLLLDNAEREKGETLSKKETVITVAPVYIPTIVVGASTVFCILGANVLSRKNQAALSSAYALINEYHKEYRGKLIELYGKEADEEIRNAIARERCDFHKIGLETPDDKVVFYEELSGESITCYEREIMDAEYHLNRNFALRGYASLNEFYEFLGLPKTEYGDAVGWSMSYGYGWIDFEHRLINRDDGGTPIYSIDMIFPPDEDYLREWEY